MPAAGEPLRYRRLRAPTEDQTALIEPPLTEIPRLVACNQALAKDWDRQSGFVFSFWRRAAREQFLDKSNLPETPIALSGHQPELFHPGVWLKNFVLSKVAHQTNGVALNLTIDNDTVSAAGIRVPAGSLESPRVEEVPLDASTVELPWEERFVLDPTIFRSFADRTAATLLRSVGDHEPTRLIEPLWKSARQLADALHADRLPLNLGLILSAARNGLERQFGLQNQIVPLSHVCSFPIFDTLFVTGLLRRAKEFHDVYNAALAEYRAANHLDSKSHPVPDLAKDGDWHEMPFWIWDTANPARRRMFVRQWGDQWELTDRANLQVKSGEYATSLFSVIRAKIRPRALITTMYARLVLSDLFIHGIGGAKYDEVTDAIIRRFFGIEPPGYVTATATVRLPLEKPQVTQDDLTALDQEYRDTVHHPEEFADEYSGHHRAEFAALAKQKQELIAHRWEEKQKKAWHDQVSAANERMSSLLEPLREPLRQKRERLLADLHRLRILGSREYSFCLFPEEMLVPLLKRLAGIQS